MYPLGYHWGLYRGYIGKMEKNMETTILGSRFWAFKVWVLGLALGFRGLRVQGLRFRGVGSLGPNWG